MVFQSPFLNQRALRNTTSFHTPPRSLPESWKNPTRTFGIAGSLFLAIRFLLDLRGYAGVGLVPERLFATLVLVDDPGALVTYVRGRKGQSCRSYECIQVGKTQGRLRMALTLELADGDLVVEHLVDVF